MTSRPSSRDSCFQLGSVLSLLAVLAGCASLQSTARLEQLDNLQRGYARALLWSEFDVAYSATEAAKTAPLPDPETYKSVKITAYEPASPLVEEEGKVLRRVAHIQYVFITRMTERNLTVNEEWRYSDDTGRWRLYRGFPAFK